VTGHFNTLVIPRGAYPARAMGQERWDRLTPEHQALLERGIAVWEAAMMTELATAWQQGYDEAVAQGVRISGMSDADQARFDALYLKDAERNAKALNRFGIDGEAVFRVARHALREPGDILCDQGERR